MVNILHIISDDKFIDAHIDRFKDSLLFDYTFVYLKMKHTYSGKYSDNLLKIRPFSKDFNELIANADQYDLIMVYYLDYNKAVFVNRLKSKVKIVWQCYGAEIYGNKLYPFAKNLYGSITRSFVKRSRFYLLIRDIYNLRFYLKNARNRSNEIDAAIKKIDYFNSYVQEEHDLFSSIIKPFPQYLQLPIRPRLQHYNLLEKHNIILLGNSCSPLNNHLEIFQLLEELDYQGKMLVPFSYGKNKRYESAISSFISDSTLNVTLLTGFVPYESYVESIQKCSAAVFNSYRQMALGNIYICLATGVKIYLSEKNPTYQWLKREGFLIYSIENDLESDIKNTKLNLKEEEMMVNRTLFNLLGNANNNQKYLEEIWRIITVK